MTVDFKTERHEHAQGFAEVGTIVHEGREFVSGGASVDDAHITAYLSPTANIRELTIGIAYPVTSWEGAALGTASVTGKWRNHPNSAFSRWLYSYRVRLADGREYNARGMGPGMVLTGKRAAPRQPLTLRTYRQRVESDPNASYYRSHA